MVYVSIIAARKVREFAEVQLKRLIEENIFDDKSRFYQAMAQLNNQ